MRVTFGTGVVAASSDVSGCGPLGVPSRGCGRDDQQRTKTSAGASRRCRWRARRLRTVRDLALALTVGFLVALITVVVAPGNLPLVLLDGVVAFVLVAILAAVFDRRVLDDNPPNLLWQGVTVRLYRQGYELTVACNNAGSVARVDRASDASGVYLYWLPTSNPHDVPISLPAFDRGGFIEHGTFEFIMRCERVGDDGDHTVTWRVVYWDSHLRVPYFSECSAVVRIALGTPAIHGIPLLDPTSPKERHARYKREYRKETNGRSTRIVQ